MTAGFICTVSVVLASTYFVCDQCIGDNPYSKGMESKFVVLFPDRIGIMNVETFTSLLSYIRDFNRFNEREASYSQLDMSHNYTMPAIHEIKFTLSHKSYEEISNEIKKRALGNWYNGWLPPMHFVVYFDLKLLPVSGYIGLPEGISKEDFIEYLNFDSGMVYVAIPQGPVSPTIREVRGFHNLKGVNINKPLISKADLSDIMENLNRLEKDKNAFYFQLFSTIKSMAIFEKGHNVLRKDFYDKKYTDMGRIANILLFVK